MDIKLKYEEIKKQLNYANQRLNESQELSRIGSWHWNVVTNEIIWSDMMFKILGFLPMEVEPSYELALHHVHIKDKERYEHVLKKALNDKTNYYLESLITCKDKTTLSVISRGKCILDGQGNLLRMIGTVQDVTYQKQLINEKEKAQEGERLKSAFLENISHELRTPLNAILGFSELILKKNITKKKYIEQINKSGKRLLSFLTDIMDISKIETGCNKLIFDNHNLNIIFDDLLIEFQKLNTNSEILLTNHKELKDDDSFIKTDVIKLKLILSKLINNSLKYTDSGVIEFGYALEDGFIKFNIKDSGIGISQKTQKNLFHKFGHIKDVKNKHYEGAGLGVPIAKGLVDLFEGEIWFVSEKKKGTNFFFTIPYIKGEYKSRNQRSNKMVKSEKKTILIAEDDPANYTLFTIHMDNQFNLLHAKNGKEAVEIFRENTNTIDLILMDIRMPVMNGFDASTQIRKINKTIPIIAHTAFAMENQIKQMEEAGINDLLNKPAQFDDVVKIIEKYA